MALVRRGYSSTGGAEAYLRRFATALRQAGHESVLFTTGDWPQEAEAPFTVRRLGTGLSPAAFAKKLKGQPAREGCDFTFSLERVLGCDCYRAGDGVHAAWLKRRAEVEPWWQPLFRQWQPKHRELRHLEQTLFGAKGAGRVITNSHLVRQEIAHLFGYPEDRLHVVYNGVPPALGEEEAQRARWELRQELGLGEHQYVLLFAGSGWERKGLRYAMAAVERVHGAEPVLLVAGAGKRRGLPSGSRTRFVGPINGLGRYLAAADVFVLPTLYDPFSNACLEALAAGLPVLTTTANGFAEVLNPEEGSILADPTDVIAWARAISDWRDPLLREAVRARLRAKGATYSTDRNLRETLAVLDLAPKS